MGDSLKKSIKPHIVNLDTPVYLVNPNRAVLLALIDAANDTDEMPAEIHILAERELIRDELADFIVSSQVADLAVVGTCSLRSREKYSRNSLLLSDAGMVFFSSSDEKTEGFPVDISDRVARIRESIAHEWKTANELPVRTPGLSSIRETMKAELGEACRDDFDALLSEIDNLRGTGGEFNEISVVVLIAARHELLLYDLSKWGESIGLASKASITRYKKQLEELGLIDTSKVPIDIGRPRQRLHLADEGLADASQAEFVNHVVDLKSSLEG